MGDIPEVVITVIKTNLKVTIILIMEVLRCHLIMDIQIIMREVG
jgi:hypothetical protein